MESRVLSETSRMRDVCGIVFVFEDCYWCSNLATISGLVLSGGQVELEVRRNGVSVKLSDAPCGELVCAVCGTTEANGPRQLNEE